MDEAVESLCAEAEVRTAGTWLTAGGWLEREALDRAQAMAHAVRKLEPMPLVREYATGVLVAIRARDLADERQAAKTDASIRRLEEMHQFRIEAQTGIASIPTIERECK